ncbi:Uncharacterised protein [uncultured Clostridium sp.]|nr:Uncharacterised protein [uncultured Clostridium sp.]
MTIQLCHKALAKCHDLTIRFALRIKIAAALTAADRKTCQRIFKYLFKAQEFDNTKIYGRMETQSALVGSDCTVKLYAKTSVYLNLSLIVYPGNAEHNLSFRIRQSLQERVFTKFFFVCLYNDAQRLQYFFYCLMEFGLNRVFLNNLRNHLINI